MNYKLSSRAGKRKQVSKKNYFQKQQQKQKQKQQPQNPKTKQQPAKQKSTASHTQPEKNKFVKFLA